MNYKEFLDIINYANFDKEVYNELINKYGGKLIKKYFRQFMNTGNVSDFAYEKCKYYLDDQLEEMYQYSNESYKEINSLKQYLDDISQFELLKPEEEKELLIKLDKLKKLKKKYKNEYNINKLQDIYCKGNNFENLDDKEVNILKDYFEVEKEYKKLSDKLFEANLRLVVYAARTYSNPNNEILDLIQEGNIGIRKAIEKFDIEKTNRFSTYAMWWIRQSILRGIHTNSRTVRLPVYKHELLYKIKQASGLYEKMNNKEPSNEELIEFIKEKINDGTLKYCKSYDSITPDLLDDIKRITQNIASINVKVGENGDSSLEDFLPNTQESVEEIVEKELVCDDIKSVLDKLNSRFKLIIILRYGFSLYKYMDYNEFLLCFNNNCSESYYKQLYLQLCKNQRIYTLEEIAALYDLTRERIRQMEAKSLRLLKNNNNYLKILKPNYLELYK